MALRRIGGMLTTGLALCASATQVVLADQCCTQLEAAFSDSVLFPGSRSFNVTNRDRFSQTAILAPSCIFQPASAQALSQAVRTLVAGACRFAVKSGGHMAVPGANNIDNGVSIDLVRLNSTVLAADRSFVSLGAGGTWGAAYDAFAAQGIAFPGGVCGTTGVGGVSLGGGESYFQPSRGWVVDNVLNYEVVLASGRLVNANHTSNCDLYRALKGGGSNFGIVTRVDVAAFNQSPIWAGQVIVPALPANVEATLEGMTKFTAMNNVDTKSGIQTVFTYFTNGSAIIDLGVGNVDGIANPESLTVFTSMRPQLVNTAGMRTLSNWVHEVDLVQPSGFRDLSATVTFRNDAATMKAVHAVTDKIFASVKDVVPDLIWIFFYIPQPKIIESYSAARGGNVLGLAEDPQDEIVNFIVPRWSDAAYDSVMYAAAQQWVDEVRNVTESHGTSRPFLYINFSLGSQKPLCAYGPDNLAFMNQVANKYDPNRVFQTFVPGGFKLSQAC